MNEGKRQTVYIRGPQAALLEELGMVEELGWSEIVRRGLAELIRSLPGKEVLPALERVAARDVASRRQELEQELGLEASRPRRRSK